MATAAPRSRVVLQQCLSARLQVQPATEGQEAIFVEIGRGLVIYLCFLKGADDETVGKMVKTVLNVKLSSGVDGKLVSVLDLPGDVLVVPQATLGGTLKGKLMQYHKNVEKETGRTLYDKFVTLCSEQLSKSPQSSEQGKVLKSGTYGNLQVLRLDTNGPYSHLIEL